jgi:UDP-glucose 4-epimerase
VQEIPDVHLVVTGAAGFIGSNLVDALLDRGDTVVGIDNLSTGHRRFLATAIENERFRFVEGDLGDGIDLVSHFEGADAVVHLAANADVRFGWQDTRRDLQQNVVVTLEIADAMRTAGVRRLLFSSTGSVYGEAPIVPTPEDAPFPRQTSLYGASKAAAEGYLSAYAEFGELDVTVFRFVSVLGSRYTHGHVIDFVSALTSDPTRLRILGDGNQSKSYLDVSDCVTALTSRLDQSAPFEVFNLGTDEYCTVLDSVQWICGRLGVEPELEFTGGDRGWVGDNPFIFLDTSAIRTTGWRPRYSIKEAVERTIDYLISNPWLLEQHKTDRD